MANPKVYFIKSLDGEDPIMEETFLACKSQQIESVLCDIAEFTNIYKKQTNPKLRNVVVTNNFSGDDFDILKQLEKIRLVGPLCVLACLNEGISIPNCKWPLLNLAMKGATVCSSNISKEDKARIKELVKLMNGETTDEYLTNTTHLVTNSVITVKYSIAAENGIYVMTPPWIDAIWKESQNGVVRYSNEQFDKYKCPVFHNLRICLTGVGRPLIDNIPALIQKHGGTYSRAMHMKNTDVLICHGDNIPNSSKYKAVMSRRGAASNIRCLSMQWIHDSIKKGYALPEDNYAVYNRSTPKAKVNEGNDMDSEMFLISRINETDISTASCTTVDGTFLHPDRPKRDISKLIDLSVLKKAITFLDGFNIYLICFTGDELAFVQRALKYTGATRLDVYSDRISHVVVGEDKNEASRQELRTVMERVRNQRHQHATHLVSMRWLIDSIKKQTPLAEEVYSVSMEMSLQGSRSMDGSPLSKKGLKLLRTDTSICVQDNITVADDLRSNNSAFKAPDELQPYMQTDEKHHETFAKYWNDVNTEDLAGVESLKNATENSIATNNKSEEKNHEADESNFLRIPKKRDQNKKKTSSSVAAEKSCLTTSRISTTLKRNDTTALDSDEDSTLELVFHNKTFQLLQFDTAAMDALTTLVNRLGGCVVSRTSGARFYRGVTDYAIVPLFSDREPTRTVTAGHVLTDLWLRECANVGRLITVDYYHRSITEAASPTVLEGCVVSTSALTEWEQAYLTEVIAHLGGCTQGDLSRLAHEDRGLLATTHLLTNSTKNKKYVYAQRWGLPIVNSNWAEESLHAGRRLPEVDYPVPEVIVDKTVIVDHSKKEDFASPNPVTPRNDKAKKQMFAVPETPQFQSPALSQPSPTQMSPVSKQYHDVLERVKARVEEGLLYDSDCESPSSTRLAAQVACKRTPDSPATPFSTRLLGPSATRTERKELREFINKIPNNTPPPVPSTRRLSTPLSELKRRFIAKVDEKYEKECEKLRKEAQNRRKALDQERQQALDASEGDVFMNEQTDTSDLVTNADANASTSNNAAVPAHIIQEKMRNLSDMLSSGTPIHNNKSSKPIPVTPVSGFSELPDSQTYSVGWDYSIEVSAAKQPAHEVRERVFIITGCLQSDKDAIQNKIELLGAKVAPEPTNFDKITHLLCTYVSRNEKTLCSIASGKWVLHVDYIEESLKAGKFLDEELYEFSNPKSKIPVDSKDEERAKGAFYWRKMVANTGKGAFHEMRAIIVSKDKENGACANIVEAGGGTVIQSPPPYENNDYATHCLIEAKMTDVSDLVPLAKCGIYCVPHIFLFNFLVNKNFDVLQSVVPKLAPYYSK